MTKCISADLEAHLHVRSCLDITGFSLVHLIVFLAIYSNIFCVCVIWRFFVKY